MKRFAFLALLAALIMGVATSASATDVNVRGSFDVATEWSSNLGDFDGDEADSDNFYADQRMRAYFDFVASENLKAVLGLEMDLEWGNDVDFGADEKG
ncbi:MAG TPA: hypothetical protein VJ934_05995, partial [Desulfomicrobiaceae bacterium]|nr:hypothetical protein [Desulfomicrobiaceae bacterium]